uniref:Uncharacterized protein n=1 Tax=viral metagenome TaxID=1070528 RepID=A0A6M3IM13_9ZZZZ
MTNQETMQQLIKDELDIFRRAGGMGSWPSEFDQDMNDITIEKIKTFAALNNNGLGSYCYLGKINRYSEDEGKPYLVPYDGQRVFNFEYGFMLPVYDEKLVELIRDREHAEYTGTKEDYRRITEIMDRIQELGGIHLFWI